MLEHIAMLTQTSTNSKIPHWVVKKFLKNGISFHTTRISFGFYQQQNISRTPAKRWKICGGFLLLSLERKKGKALKLSKNHLKSWCYLRSQRRKKTEGKENSIFGQMNFHPSERKSIIQQNWTEIVLIVWSCI